MKLEKIKSILLALVFMAVLSPVLHATHNNPDSSHDKGESCEHPMPGS